MIDPVSLQMVRDVVTIFGVVAGFTYYVLSVRNAQKTRELTLKAQEQVLETRQVQFCWQALERVHDKEFMRRTIEIMYHMDFKDYEEWREKYGPSTNPDAYVDYYEVTSTHQGLGYLVQNGVLDPEALSKHIRPRAIILLWEKIEPIVKVHRERLNPTAYDSFEYLADEMRALLDQRMAQASTQTVSRTHPTLSL